MDGKNDAENDDTSKNKQKRYILFAWLKTKTKTNYRIMNMLKASESVSIPEVDLVSLTLSDPFPATPACAGLRPGGGRIAAFHMLGLKS